MDSQMLSLAGGSLMDWMHGMHVGIGNMEFFTLINTHLNEMISQYQENLLRRVGKLVGAVAVMIVTLWIVMQGFRIVTGQSREPMMGLVVNSLKAVLIVGVALTTAATTNTSYGALTEGLTKVVRSTVTKSEGDGPYADMDKVLGFLQLGLEVVDSVDVGESQMTNDTKETAMKMISVGLGAPVIMSMTAMLLNKIAMALFIGTGPFFILCLLFDQTKQLFQKWLFYGLATMMSMAVLIVMTTIAIDMLIAVGGAFWASSLLTGGDTESLMSLAMQQGGLGTILSALIITAPAMAGSFFNGVLGQFSPYNAFQNNSSSNSHPAPGQPYPQQAPPPSQARQVDPNQGYSRPG